MKWKYTLLSGAIIGALLSIFMVVNVLIDVVFDSFATAMVSFLLIILVTPFITKEITTRIFSQEICLEHLFPISILTFLIPVIGISFGAPNSDLDTILLLILIGTIGGIFWSVPFALRSHYKGSDNESITDPAREEE